MITVTLICIAFYLIGLLFCTQSGTYWVEIFDNYSGNWAILIVAMFECIAITWFYGFDKFKLDISTMIGKRLTNNRSFLIWKAFWLVLSPLTLMGVVIFSWIDMKPLELNGFVFPYWSNVVGNLLSVSTISGTIGWMIFSVINVKLFKKLVTI